MASEKNNSEPNSGSGYGNLIRTAVVLLTLSATSLGSLKISEGFVKDSMIPIPGDIPTIGYGTTVYANGTKVKLGETITKERADIELKQNVSIYEAAVKRCASVPMYQYEYDAFVNFTYNLGVGAFCYSSIPALLKAGNYTAACNKMLEFNKAPDPRKPKVWNAKKGRMEHPLSVVRGLTKRRVEETNKCLNK